MVRFLGSPVSGTILAATAENPKAIDPSEVEGGDPPRGAPRLPRDPGVAGLRPGEAAGDEEAHRAEGVRAPDQLVGLGRGQRRLQGVEGAEVEEDGAHQLDQRRPPVDAGRLPGQDSEPAGVRVTGRRPCRVHRLQILQERRRREEDRPDEEGPADHGGAHQADVTGHRSGGEAGGSDHEQHADPPRHRPGCPPHGAAPGVQVVPALAVGARLPDPYRSIRPAEGLSGDEWSRAARFDGNPPIGHVEVTGWHRGSPFRPAAADAKPPALASARSRQLLVL